MQFISYLLNVKNIINFCCPPKGEYNKCVFTHLYNNYITIAETANILEKLRRSISTEVEPIRGRNESLTKSVM